MPNGNVNSDTYPYCTCQYADDGRVLYADSDCRGLCKPDSLFVGAVPAPSVYYCGSVECPGHSNSKSFCDVCKCGADLHPGHVCPEPVTVTEPYVGTTRPCLHCQAPPDTSGHPYKVIAYTYAGKLHEHRYYEGNDGRWYDRFPRKRPRDSYDSGRALRSGFLEQDQS